jgi:hypothetical protein
MFSPLYVATIVYIPVHAKPEAVSIPVIVPVLLSSHIGMVVIVMLFVGVVGW